MAKKRARKAKPAARKTAEARPHSRIEVIFRRKEFGKAPAEKRFILHDGRRIESLYQLVDELETMSEDAFRQFVNEWKNDFAAWARDVFEAGPLADELQRIRGRIETQRAVMKHLLRDVAHVMSEQHIEHARKAAEQEQRSAGHPPADLASQGKSKAVKVIIHEP